MIRIEMIKDSTFGGYSDKLSTALKEVLTESMHLEEDLKRKKK